MRHCVTGLLIMHLSLLSLSVLALEPSSYSGQEQRPIKALSDTRINGLLSGKGMGYAKAAELNGYPGPAHVLELASDLSLSPSQHTKTQAIFDRMLSRAKTLGAELVAAERKLDQAFKQQQIDEPTLLQRVKVIADIEAELRAVHLKAHLQQTDVLNDQQIRHYMMLRGYHQGNHADHSHGH